MTTFLHSPPWDAGAPEFWEAWQPRQLRHYLKHRVLPFSAHYRQLFQQHGIEAGDIRTLQDWAKMPFTSKSDLLGTSEHQREFALMPDQRALMREPHVIFDALMHGRSSARDHLEEEFRPILLTSTTGRSADPVPFLYTKHDLDNLSTTGRRIMEVGGSRREYRHVNLFPYAPHLGFWQAHHASLGFGTFMLSTGGGKSLGTDGNIAMIERIRPDIIIGMPTFIYHVMRQAVEEKRRWTSLKRIVLGGEKVAPGLRTKLRGLSTQLGSLGVSIISTYAFTEAKMAWPECPTMPHEQPSGYHLYPDHGIVEIIDPESGRVLPPGTPGEIVFTPLDARGTVVLRYRTGDLAEGGIVFDACPHCGRRCPRIVGPISRVSERKTLALDKVKGTLVDFNALEHLLDDQLGIAAWQIELRKQHDDPLDIDEVIVHAAAEPGTSEGAVRENIARRFFETTEFKPNAISFHSIPEMRERLGIGHLLKEEKISDHRAKISSTLGTAPVSNSIRPQLLAHL